MHPNNGEIERYTDHYFNRTKRVIGKFGDSRVTYAIFMRRPVVFAPRLALDVGIRCTLHRRQLFCPRRNPSSLRRQPAIISLRFDARCRRRFRGFRCTMGLVPYSGGQN